MPGIHPILDLLYKNPQSLDEVTSYFSQHDINMDIREGDRMIHFAVLMGNSALMKMLVRFPGIKLDVKNDSGSTALHDAIQYGCYDEAVELIRANPKLINVLNDAQLSPLGVRPSGATDESHEKSPIKFILSNYSNQISESNFKSTMVMYIRQHRPLAVALFYESGLFSIQSDIKYLHELCRVAAMEGDIKILDYLLRACDHLGKSKELYLELAQIAANHGRITLLDHVNALSGYRVERDFPLAFELIYHSNREGIESAVSRLNLGENRPPHLAESDMALILAAKTSKSKEYLHCVVIKEAGGIGSNLTDFILQLKKYAVKDNLPVRVHFVVADVHCLVGEILIDKDESIKACIVDPTGENGPAQSSNYMNEVARDICHIFPQCKIYMGIEKKQRDWDSCGLFSIDDVLHLYRADRYFRDKYAGKDLYYYLDNHVIKKKTIIEGDDIIPVTFSTLPLRFIRMEQSLHGVGAPDNFFYQAGIFPRLERADLRELTWPINKKGQTVVESVNDHIWVNHAKVKVNKRNEYKLDKMREMVLTYMLTATHDQVAADVRAVKVEGFFSGLAEQKIAKKLR